MQKDLKLILSKVGPLSSHKRTVQEITRILSEYEPDLDLLEAFLSYTGITLEIRERHLQTEIANLSAQGCIFRSSQILEVIASKEGVASSYSVYSWTVSHERHVILHGQDYIEATSHTRTGQDIALRFAKTTLYPIHSYEPQYVYPTVDGRFFVDIGTHIYRYRTLRDAVVAAYHLKKADHAIKQVGKNP